MSKTTKLFFDSFLILLAICLFISIENALETLSIGLIIALMCAILFDFITTIAKPIILKTPDDSAHKAYMEVFENSASIAKLGLDFHIKYVNRSFSQLTLSTKEECLQKKLDSFLEGQNEVVSEIHETLRQNQTWDGVITLTTKHNNHAHIKCTIKPIPNEIGDAAEYLLVAHDLTELTISKQLVRTKMYRDNHTQLPNRVQLIEDKVALLNKQEMTLMLFNIDSFQAINSIYGNQIGDEVLIATAHWLKMHMPCKLAKLYKFEADVFAIFIPAHYDNDALKNYLNDVSKKISEEGLVCSGIGINITFTIGAVQSKTDLLKFASIAYKVAKKEQKAFWIYDIASNKDEEYLQNVKIINIIKKSLSHNGIVPYFQPIFDIKNKKIDKYETLIRIKKEDGSVHLPYEFLDIAKHSKLYPTLSRDIIGKAFDAFRFSSNEFSINLSFLDVSNAHTIDFIFNKMNEYTIGSCVVFEILESEGIHNYATVLKFIEKAKSYGAKIAIDDFGSGYSNFERLVKLQPDYIKIDGGLIKNIDKNEDMKIITQTIVDFSKKLGAKTIAEYVHSKEIFDIIKEMGVDFAQGYYIGKPSPNLENDNTLKF
ncbi:EAL domain-containing protein [Sulfurospirillum sp. 1612]|uniref:EAL domain-containing protein n=1 Tax=Sulfurospirillum sp. 1612 TaxID=3094835 RepID=UPI002F95C5A3